MNKYYLTVSLESKNVEDIFSQLNEVVGELKLEIEKNTDQSNEIINDLTGTGWDLEVIPEYE